MKKLNKKGFTLTELIVVIAVIAILAAVLIPTLTGYIEKARVSADNQEVAVLNKLLLGAEIDEVEFENVPQLKKYLEEEMDYDGDYSLGVKGSYLCFDKEKYEFVIVKESDVEGLVTMSSGYKLATGNISSPEALFENNNDAEVWIIGGKGELVEIVEEIRNIGNNGSDLTKFNSLSNNDVKALLTKLFDNYVFSGTAGTFEVEANGKVKLSTNTEKAVISTNGSTESLSVSQLRAEFHKNVILANIDSINNSLGTKAEIIIDKENPYDIKVVIKENGLFEIVGSIFDIVRIISENGCESGYVIPKEFNTLEEYLVVLNTLIDTTNNNEKQSDALIGFKGVFANQVTTDGYDPTNTDTYCKINLSSIKEDEITEEEESEKIKALLNMVYPIFVALNLYENEELYDTKATTLEYNMNLIKNKNTIRIIGNISNSYTIQYDFTFDTSALNQN